MEYVLDSTEPCVNVRCGVGDWSKLQFEGSCALACLLYGHGRVVAYSDAVTCLAEQECEGLSNFAYANAEAGNADVEISKLARFVCEGSYGLIG